MLQADSGTSLSKSKPAQGLFIYVRVALLPTHDLSFWEYCPHASVIEVKLHRQRCLWQEAESTNRKKSNPQQAILSAGVFYSHHPVTSPGGLESDKKSRDVSARLGNEIWLEYYICLILVDSLDNLRETVLRCRTPFCAPRCNSGIAALNAT